MTSSPRPVWKMRRLLWIALLSLVTSAHAQGDFSAGMEAYERGDYAAALAHWRPLAEAGSPEAQFNVGLIHAKGLGTEADPEMAVRWYERAAEQGFPQAQYNLAKMYESGEGVAEDLVLAYVWYKIASTKKYADARKRRKKVAKRLTPHDVAQADLMVREWLREREPG